jgi:hypothetical protein
MIQGWGDSRNPDVLQNELNSAAEVAGGAAATGEAMRTGGGPITQQVRKNIADKVAAKIPDQQLTDFKNAVPPSKSAPYTDVDYHNARPYLEAEHSAATPIDSPLGLRDAADSAIGKIEDKIADRIQARPEEQITTNPIEVARQALKGSVRTDFLQAGLKELENYPLGFERAGGEVDPPLTLQRADDIRWQLNQDNKAVLAKNNYDLNTARATDPGFAAREAAAEALRNGIYDKLEQLGFKDTRAMRRDEGSLMKIRNASMKQEFNGEKAVRGTQATSPARKVAGKVAKTAAVAGGAALGSTLGPLGAAGGAEAGVMAGNLAERAIAPGPMTRSALLDRAFSSVSAARPVQITSQTARAAGAGSTAANSGRILFRASDNSLHSVPDNGAAINHARQIDPGLEILP